jgi:hypothetical protein
MEEAMETWMKFIGEPVEILQGRGETNGGLQNPTHR